MITTIISFVIVLGILIFIHEVGHFAMAKFSGVGVEKFSLGFGPKVFGMKYGETEYLLSLLPLGGYVKMVGEHSGEDISEADKSRSFNNKSVSARAMIVAAGPIMNLVLALLIFPLIYMIGINVPAYLEKPAQVGFVVKDDPAARAGIRKGDVIEAVNGKAVKDWQSLLETLILNPNVPLETTVNRGGDLLNTTLTPGAAKDTGGGYAGMYPPMKPAIGRVEKGSPADDAGLVPGDVILAVNGASITHWFEMVGFLRENGSAGEFLIGRGGETFTVAITPRFDEQMKVFLIGIGMLDEGVFKGYGFFESIGKGVSSAVEMTGRLFYVIKGLVVGQYSLKTLGGPIMIAKVTGQAAADGIVPLLSLMAFLSLQLGIINLFPIPVLDGGHLMFFGIEAVKGKPLSERFMGITQQVGIALLIALMVLVTYNDIVRIIFG
jgi:regulator of sigma E protease